MTFAQTIRAKRESMGLTQAEFAHKLTVSQQTVNNWETGRFEPWPRKKAILLDQLGKGVMPPVRFNECTSDTRPVSATLAYQRKRHPNVCEEIAAESAPDPGRQESVAHEKIDFRRPPGHWSRG